MPTVPSGVLYFMVWKYLLYGALLFVLFQIFQYLGGFETFDEFKGVAIICIASLAPLTWFEYGDYRLKQKWQVDQERSNTDRVAKAFIYVTCCIAWPKYVFGDE